MTSADDLREGVRQRDAGAIARAVSWIEEGPRKPAVKRFLAALAKDGPLALRLGVTGPPGAGKSTLVDRLLTHFRGQGKRVGVVAVDPSSPVSGGAVLGDRIRMMGHALDPDVVIRSLATRGQSGGLCAACEGAVTVLAAAGCDPVLIETVGVGQLEADVVRLAQVTVLVLAPGGGDDIQGLKAGLVEIVDLVAVNKMDLPGAEGYARIVEGMARENRRRFCRVSAREGAGIAKLAGLVDEVRKEKAVRPGKKAAGPSSSAGKRGGG